jgi:hypothetical protein
MSQSNEPTPAEPTKVSLSYEVKIGLPNYSNVVVRAFVERRVTEGLSEEGELSVAYSLAHAAVDEALFDFGGVAAVVPQVKAVKTERDGTETPLADSEVERLAAAFGGSVETEPRPPVAAGRMPRIAGKQHGELPAWLADCGYDKVFDNRDGLTPVPGEDAEAAARRQKRPWFKDASVAGGKGKGIWPPKGA